MRTRCSGGKADDTTAARRPGTPDRDTAASERAARGAPMALVRQAQADPRSLRRADVRGLHRTIGNRSVGAVVGGQARLTVGRVRDAYEREADRVAGEVMHRLAAPTAPQPADAGPSGPRAPAIAQGAQRQAHATGSDARDVHGGAATSALFGQAVGRHRGRGTPLDPGLQRAMGEVMGADFGGVRVHTGEEPDRLSGAIQATAFTVGQDVFFRGSSYNPRTPSGQELIAHELTHVVQQNGSRVRRTPAPQPDGDLTISPAPGGRAQRRFGFEIELPILFTREADYTVHLDDGTEVALHDVPRDAGEGGPETHLVDSGECYLNVDHNRTLDPLFIAHLAQYGRDNQIADDQRDALLAVYDRLIPSHASIVEVVTKPWNESSLSRNQALQKVRSVIRDVEDLYQAVAGGKAQSGNYFVGSDAPNAVLFQQRIGYFHATYGVKLSQVPYVFKQTTEQAKRLAKYAAKSPIEKPHAMNVELTRRSVAAAKAALKEIRNSRPRVLDSELSKTAEKDFLGFLTLVCNYFLLMRFGIAGATLAKQAVGMHYYKSDLYDVANTLPAEVTDPLKHAQTGAVDRVIGIICESVGIVDAEDFNGMLSRLTAKEYLYQIFRGEYGVIKKEGVVKLDASGQTFMDPVLGRSINEWSSKLGPEKLGPKGNRGMGVVMENRHLEYLDPNYGATAAAWDTQYAAELAQYRPPAGPDNRSAQAKAMYDSLGARDTGPARKPIEQWESLMMGIYDMVKAANSRK